MCVGLLLLCQIGGYWSSGLPYLDASYKSTKRPWEAGLQLPLMMLNITDLQVRSECWGTAVAACNAECNALKHAGAQSCCAVLTMKWPDNTTLMENAGTTTYSTATSALCHLQAAVAALAAEAWTYEYQAKHSAVMAGREGNQNAFKPGGA